MKSLFTEEEAGFRKKTKKMKHPMTSNRRKLLTLLGLREQRKEKKVTGNQKVGAAGEGCLTGAVSFSRG